MASARAGIRQTPPLHASIASSVAFYFSTGYKEGGLEAELGVFYYLPL